MKRLESQFAPTRRRLCLATALALAGCASEPRQRPTRVLSLPEQALEGESAGLIHRVRARIVVDMRAGHLGVLDTTHWRLGLRAHPGAKPAVSDDLGRALPIWEISNPAQDGTVAVLVADEGDRRHAIRLLRPGHPQRVLWRGPGEPLWDRPVSGMALSPDGARLALVAQPDPTVRHRPLHSGRLVVLDLQAPPRADGMAPEVNLPDSVDGAPWVLGQRPAWLQGAVRLLVACPGPKGRAATGNPVAPALQPDPQLELIDLERRTREVIVPGHSPLASGDGLAFMAARGPSFHWAVVDATTRRVLPVERRHGLGTPLALIEQRYLIYTGAAHPQSLQEFTVNNSPLVGPKAMLALKVMDLQTAEVLTLLEGVDPRRRISAAPLPA